MTPFTTHSGKVALLDWTDVNTDLIIPARYLKRIERTGYGPLLFADKRYETGTAPPVDDPEQPGRPDPAFPLNEPRYEGASILVVGRNFGCGSSREHAVWAIAQGGYRVLLGRGKNEGFADIFEGNAYNNGLLPIELDEAAWDQAARAAGDSAGCAGSVDLGARTIELVPGSGPALRLTFEVADEQRHRLLNGLDAIGETLVHEEAIRAFERQAPAWTGPRVS